MTATVVPPRKTSILIASDAPMVARDLQRRLVELGYEVPAMASTAATALALASERLPDLVLVDIALRDDDAAVEEIACILRERFDIPVLYRGLLTAAAGAAEALRETVDSAITKHAMERRLRAQDITAPLTAAYANVRLALEAARGPLDETARDAIEQGLGEALVGIERLQRIVGEIRAAASGGGAGREIDVIATIETSLRDAAPELAGRAKISCNFQPVAHVLADQTRLSQVLVHILTNAAHAIPRGDREHNEVAIATRMIDGEVAIEIRDTGSGMPADVQARIFEPFFTTKTPGDGHTGLGLGLAVSHGIVTSLRGRIEVDSELGRGSTFRVRLPRAGDEVPQPSHSEIARPRTASGTDRHARYDPSRADVLVIDDEPVIRRIMTRVLGREYNVTAPETPVDAIALLRERAYDAIVCDLMMPELTGMDIHDELIRSQPGQARRMVFVSGGTFDARIMEFVRSVDNAKLDKPFAPDDLRALIAMVIATCGRVGR